MYLFNNKMSSVTSTQKKLTLIEKPKSRKDWENNKAYYQQKFFSNKQKKDLEERKHKEEMALKEIGKRQEFGSCGILAYRAGGGSKIAERKAWEYKMESMKVVYEKYYNNADNTNTPIPSGSDVLEAEVDSHPRDNSNVTECSFPVDNSYLNLHHRTDEAVDSWEDLC